MKLIISQKEVVLKIHRREHALSKIYKESIINRFMMKNLKIHHQMMNLITQKKTCTEILKTIPNFKRMIKMERKREKRKIKITKKRNSMMKNN